MPAMLNYYDMGWYVLPLLQWQASSKTTVSQKRTIKELKKRLTIVIDEDNLEKLLHKRARAIEYLKKPYSFSRAANDVLRAGFRAEE